MKTFAPALFAITMLAVCIGLFMSAGSKEKPLPADLPEAGMGRLVGRLPSSGCRGLCIDVRVLEVDGTKCIFVGQYTATSISCDWGKP